MTASPAICQSDDPARRRRYGNAESRIQASIVTWIRTVAPQLFVFHVPNGGLRSKSEAAKLKWMGVVPGIPDLCIIAPGGFAYFLECKAPGGALSDEQKSMILALAKRGARSRVVMSIDETRDAFRKWGIETREAHQ